MQPEDPESCAAFRHSLAHRLRYVRRERFGEHGLEALAELLKVSARTWTTCESCGTISGGLLLRFIEVTGVEPCWLLRGSGPRYRSASAQTAFSQNTRSKSHWFEHG